MDVDVSTTPKAGSISKSTVNPIMSPKTNSEPVVYDNIDSNTSPSKTTSPQNLKSPTSRRKKKSTKVSQVRRESKSPSPETSSGIVNISEENDQVPQSNPSSLSLPSESEVDVNDSVSEFTSSLTHSTLSSTHSSSSIVTQSTVSSIPEPIEVTSKLSNSDTVPEPSTTKVIAEAAENTTTTYQESTLPSQVKTTPIWTPPSSSSIPSTIPPMNPKPMHFANADITMSTIIKRIINLTKKGILSKDQGTLLRQKMIHGDPIFQSYWLAAADEDDELLGSLLAEVAS